MGTHIHQHHRRITGIQQLQCYLGDCWQILKNDHCHPNKHGTHSSRNGTHLSRSYMEQAWTSLQGYQWLRSPICCAICERPSQTHRGCWKSINGLSSSDRWTNWMNQPRSWTVSSTFCKPSTVWLVWVVIMHRILIQWQSPNTYRIFTVLC